MAKLALEVFQPTKTKVSGEFDHIIVPGIDGDFGISENHTPFITKIRPGILQLFSGTKIDRYAIHDGFVTVDNNKIVIVCDVIENEKEIDSKRAEASKERAEKRLKASAEEVDFRRAEFALKRSLVRLELGK
jgi:F-type H+-transporting ATPase subunit epsilon